MFRVARNILNPDTLLVERHLESRYRWWQWLSMALVGVFAALAYLWIYVAVLGLDLPKTALLKKENAVWNLRIDQMSAQLDRYEEILSMLEQRDNNIYRTVYGLEEIPPARRSAGFMGGDLRYAPLEGTRVKSAVQRLDILAKRTSIQASSFDEVAALQLSAGDLASHIPAIPPLSTDRSTYRLTSPFGTRKDPLNGGFKRHTGMDFGCKVGNPIYATGDGVVSKVAHDVKGYGNQVMIDHGFGYVTRYAHLSQTEVEVGQRVKRGDRIGLSGKSGRSTGPHLHYEVLYRKHHVNPIGFMDLGIDPEDYVEIIHHNNSGTEE